MIRIVLHRRPLHALALVASALLLAACGGSPGNSGPPALTSYPLLAGYKSRIGTGASDNFVISGSCNGTATLVTSASTAATFEGLAGYSTQQTASVNFTNCQPASATASGVGFYDTNFSPLGSFTPGVDYSKYQSLPTPLPSIVAAGDSGVIATLIVYADITKTTVTGQRVFTYVIESDAANGVIANLITKGYDASSQLLFTQQSRYRIAANGTLEVLTIDVQYSTTSTNRLLYTKA